MYQNFLKGFIDLSVAAVALMFLSPLIVIVIIILSIVNRGMPFFFQLRPGKNERIIRIVKFKTMTDRTDREGRLLPDKDRITAFGSFLRRTSIDEIPQFFNVLIGDMSLIGPRPLLVRYLGLYNEEQRRRHSVKPGITGWAQVNGRNTISWTEKFKLDIYYVDNISFKLDILIFWRTVLKVLKREGVNQSSDRPMEPFNGKN